MMQVRFFDAVKLSCFGVLLAVPAGTQALTWSTNSPLPGSGKRNNSVVSQGADIYSLGGRPDDDDGDTYAADDIYHGVIDNTGAITWVKAPNSLPGKRTEGGTAIVNGKIYYWGGWTTNFPTLPTCYYAPLAAGIVGPWITSSVTLPQDGGEDLGDSFGRNNLAFNNTLYTINGENNSGNLSNLGNYSRLTLAGDYGTWTSTNEPGDSATWWHGMAVFQGTSANYIYKIGGGPDANAYSSAENTVQRAEINADGSLGSWIQLTDTIPAPNGIMDFACIQDGNKIYIVGGSDNTGTAQTSVYIGEINASNGDIAWSTDADALPEARVRVSGNLATAPNGTKYLVIPGGAAATGVSPGLNTVLTAPLPPPTEVKNWEMY
jgi:hypothetical protein